MSERIQVSAAAFRRVEERGRKLSVAAWGLVFLVIACARVRSEEPTFSHHIAPLLWKHCAECHRDGQVAPFPLMSFADARKHATQILEMVESGEMPPWLPSDKGLPMKGRRGLAEAEIATLRQWVQRERTEGAPLSGDDYPVFPEDEWRLGTPDLVLELETPWSLPAEGLDVFRNFVIPNPLQQSRYVRAVEFRFANPKVVHHAILHLDRNGSCRRLDALDDEPGFPGMRLGEALPPDGHFIAWSPGKSPNVVPKGMAWQLVPGMDLALQLHMLPSGKPETVSPQIGLFFTDTPPRFRPYAFDLQENRIEIPAGESDYLVRQEFTVPVEAALLALYPHAHYVCREMKVVAELPDGQSRTILDIPNWDFDWQDLYTLEKPEVLPEGTKIAMEYIYDNSESNLQNPFSPPQPVRAGNRSQDEMGNLWVQMLPWDDAGHEKFESEQLRYAAETRPSAHNFYNYGRDLQVKGEVDAAIRQYRRGIELDSSHASSHYQLSLALLSKGEDTKAFDELKLAAKHNPQNPKYRFQKGVFHANRDEFAAAKKAFEEAVRLDPDYPRAAEYLEVTNEILREQSPD